MCAGGGAGGGSRYLSPCTLIDTGRGGSLTMPEPLIETAFPRAPWVGIAWMGMILLANASAATVQVLDKEHEEKGGDNKRFRFNAGATSEIGCRLGIVTFEGTTYMAARTDGNGVRLVPMDGRGVPIENDTIIYEVNYSSPLLVADLVPYNGFLFLVAYSPADGKAHVHRFRKSPVSEKLEPVGEPLSFNAEGYDNLRAVIAVAGGKGVYVYFLQGNPREIVCYQVNGATLSAKMIAHASLGGGQVPKNLTPSCDGVAVQEMRPNGIIDEVHYLAWAGTNGGGGGSYTGVVIGRLRVNGNDNIFEIRNTSLPVNPDDTNVFTLVDSGLATNNPGTEAREFCLSLLNFKVGPGWSGNRVLQVGTFLPAKFDFSSSEWMTAAYDFEQNPRKYTAMHWGVEKGLLVASGEPDSPKGIGSKFVKRLQRTVRASIVGFCLGSSGIVKPRYTSYHRGTMLGNKFVPDNTVGTDGFLKVDTAQAESLDESQMSDKERKEMLAAWRLVGVVHGVPPYLPYSEDHQESYPSISIQWSRQVEKTESVSVRTEQSWHVGTSISVGSEEIARGAEKAAGIVTASGSYTYSVTAAQTRINSKMESFSVEDEIQLRPRKDIDPSSIGWVFYSVPVIASRVYKMVRWDDAEFTDRPRKLVLSTFERRQLMHYSYLLEYPERGPLETMVEGKKNRLRWLTRGIRPVGVTRKFNEWRPPKSPINYSAYKEFHVIDDSEHVLETGLSGGRRVTLAYGKKNADGTEVEDSYSHTISGDFSIGLANILRITAQGGREWVGNTTTTTTTEISVGRAITINYPELWTAPNQPITKIRVRPYLFHTDEDNSNELWTPKLMRETSAPFLLTWEVESVLPVSFRRKWWGLPRTRLSKPPEPALWWVED